MPSQSFSSTTPFVLEADLDGVSTTSMEVNPGYSGSSDGCPFPGSLSSAYHLRSSCSLTPLPNGPQDSVVGGCRANAAIPQHEATHITTQRENRVELIRAALTSLRIDLPSPTVSKMCVSDRDILSLQERLMANNVEDGKNKDGPDARRLQYKETTKTVTEDDTVGNTWLIHDHPHMSRRKIPGHAARRVKTDPVNEEGPEVSFAGAIHLDE